MVNVLIADNNINYVKNLMNYINEGNEKIRVTKIAEDGMETLKILNNDKNIDIALLDFDMPGYDANQICKKVINKEKYKQSILVGIILGTFVYIVWVQKAKKKNLFIESVICGGMMLILVVLVNVIYELVFYVMMKNLGQEAYIYSLNDVYDIKNVAIICVGIFAVVYVGNYIYQRIMVSRLNKELNK